MAICGVTVKVTVSSKILWDYGISQSYLGDVLDHRSVVGPALQLEASEDGVLGRHVSLVSEESEEVSVVLVLLSLREDVLDSFLRKRTFKIEFI